MSLTILSTILKILAKAKEGVLLTHEIAKVVNGLEGEGGKPIVHMTDDELLEALSKKTINPDVGFQEGRDQVSGE
jgi:hypothetical protein|tara:strand:- start:1116 stop:1340 length:225 start_codon:yes stop_codon:yes gene_type:complete